MTLLPSLNDAQKQAVTHASGPLLIVAGAGTGKTTVVTQRIAWLISDQHIQPDHILALTFTDKAAGEMEERVDKLLPMGYVDLWVSTFHSFCERILRDHALDIGLSPDFTLLDETDQAILMREHLETFDLSYYRPLGNPTKFVSSLIKHFSRCKDEAIRPEEYLKFAEKLRLDLDNVHGRKKKSDEDKDEIVEAERINEIANAYHTYQQLLFQKGSLDFGDLITQTLYLFQQRPKILERYRKQFEYILVDEFQDTNWAQYELVKLLAAPQNNLTVVGDDDQSIYKFRGASVANILAFKTDFPKAKEVVLTQNYRSTQNILDLAYDFIQANNPNRLEVQLKGAKGKAEINKKLAAQEKGKGTIEYTVAPILEQEATGVVEKILELKKKKGTSYNDFAILVRANDSAQPFLQRLKAADVPFQFVATAGLYRQPIVLDILNYLKLLDNFHESASLYRMLTLPSLGIPLQDVMSMMATARRETKSLYEVCQNLQIIKSINEETPKKVATLLGWVSLHSHQARTKNVGEVALAFLNDSGIYKILANAEDEENRDQLEYVNQLFKDFSEFQNRHDEPTVKNYLKELEFALDVGDSGSLQPSEADMFHDTVRIMTIHSAKGLEFQYVFIANLVDKRFPTIQRRDAIELPDALVREKLPEGDWHLQEERRLMYVAITRAKQGVYFTAAEDYGGSRKKKPSRFIEELGLKAKPFKLKGGLLDKPKAPKREEDDATLLRKALPPYFSFTQLKAFEKCPKQYKYAHLLKIPVPGHATLSFGQTIHNTLLNFFKLARERGMAGQADLFGKKDKATTGPAVTWAELQQIYQANWQDMWYSSVKQKNDYKQRGVKFLKNFYDSLPTPWPQPTELEKGFTIVINGHKVKGKIDRIDPSTGGIEIIDYKTSEKPPEEDKADLEQLHIYAMAAREALGLNPVKLTFIYLAAEKPFTYPIDEKAIEKTRAEIGETIEAILKSDFVATPSKFTCASCDFRNICEDRWKG